jgi:hypothetical protein
MGSSKACWQGPVLRHLAGFTAFGKGFYARRNCENAGMAEFIAQTPQDTKKRTTASSKARFPRALWLLYDFHRDRKFVAVAGDVTWKQAKLSGLSKRTGICDTMSPEAAFGFTFLTPGARFPGLFPGVPPR